MLRSSISSSWYEVTGKVSEGHLRAGTHIEGMCPVKCVNRPVQFHESYPAINSGCSTLPSSLRSSFARDPALK